jgi:hypothetical protein
LDNFTEKHSTTNDLTHTSTSDCSNINVFLKNEPFYLHSHYAYGNYNASETLVNGKSYWKNSDFVTAIWYESSSNLWIIGILDQISQGLGDFYAPNHFSGLTDDANQWHFKDGDYVKWKSPSDPNDILVTCID